MEKEKLKTLKEIDLVSMFRGIDPNGKDYWEILQHEGKMAKQELRAEAVKRVNKWCRNDDIGDFTCIYFIKHFFNLTSEDLK